MSTRVPPGQPGFDPAQWGPRTGEPEDACDCGIGNSDGDHPRTCAGWDVARKRGIAPYRQGRRHGYPWVIERSDDR